ncbi:MAG: hypothetical protein JNL08_04470 [Planctomycetes bacterium]|nr:hypothetical protein [Planctomycetota bacterium]
MRHPILLLVSLVFAGAAAAQQFDLGAAHGIVRDDHGQPWAIGSGYKATYAAGAFTFVPALGSAAAANRPLTLRLRQIAVGDQQLLAADAVAGELQAGERHLAIRRGPVVERYDARRDGVEQSFVFASRPAGDGDLVVHLTVETGLGGHRQPDGTLFFHDGRVGGVTIGAVTGIDAAQRRCAGSLQLDGDTLELRLPAAFVASAAYPLTLDPLLAPGFLIGDSFFDEDQVDAAHGVGDGSTLVVYRRVFSYFDQDIRAQRVAADGSLVGAPLSITLTPTNEGRPAVCYVRSRDRHVVCWNEAPVPFGPWTLRARSVQGTTLGIAIGVSGAAGSRDAEVSMAGDRSFTGTAALVAWQGAVGSSGDVFTATIDVGATGNLVASLPYDVTTAALLPFSQRMWLAKSRVPNGMVLLGATSSIFADTHVAVPLGYDGHVVGSIVVIGSGGVGVPSACAFDGDGIEHVAAWRTGAGQLEALPIGWDGTALTVGAGASIAATVGLELDVGCLGERFVVTWLEPTANPFDNELRGIALKPDCAVCSETFQLDAVARPNALAPRVAPAFAGGSAVAEALLAWNETELTPPFRGSVVGRRYAAMVGLPAQFLSAGCGNGGTASAIGAFAPGNEGFSFNLTGGDPTAPFALLSLSLGGSSILCGCELTNFLVLEAELALNGTARRSFLPWCDPVYLGTQIEFQWLLWPAAASPCPFVPNLAASNRMLVTLAP